MKKCFLENLPKSGKGINWKKSIGRDIDFIYEDIKGVLTIINYKQGKVQVKYNGQESDFVGTDIIKNCNLGNIIGKIIKDYRFEIGDIVNNKKILEQIVISNKRGKVKGYKIQCLNCKHIYDIEENKLVNSNNKCRACCNYNKKVAKGINDIATTDPWMIPFFKNKEDAYNYISDSGKFIYMICPYCGEEKLYKINKLKRFHKLPCTCSDNISFPEKFMINLLKQINIDFIWQYTKKHSNWCEEYKYDFYFEINKEKYIIEVHGDQHYNERGFNNYTSNQKENDQYKYELAIFNGIKPENYIIIDFRESTLEWGKEHILNSRLSEIFDLSKINWEECEEYALKNIIKEVCDYWRSIKNINPLFSTKELKEEFQLDRTTLSKYLKIGNERGWCIYNIQKEIENGHIKQRKTGSVYLYEAYTKEGKIIIKGYLIDIINYFKSNLGIDLKSTSIQRVCRGERKHYKGFIFKYVKIIETCND